MNAGKKWEVESQVLWHTQVLVVVVFLLACLLDSMVVRFSNRRKSSKITVCTELLEETEKGRKRKSGNESETRKRVSVEYMHKEHVYEIGMYRASGKFEAKMEKKMSTNYHRPTI